MEAGLETAQRATVMEATIERLTVALDDQRAEYAALQAEQVGLVELASRLEGDLVTAERNYEEAVAMEDRRVEELEDLSMEVEDKVGGRGNVRWRGRAFGKCGPRLLARVRARDIACGLANGSSPHHLDTHPHYPGPVLASGRAHCGGTRGGGVSHWRAEAPGGVGRGAGSEHRHA